MKSQINTILIPTDFSEPSESALKVGLSIARRQKSDVILLHVLDQFAYMPPAEVFLPGFPLKKDIESTMKKKLEDISVKIQKETGIKIIGKILDGIPSVGICQFAFDEKISLIVMGTHGTSGLREFFVGSEAFRVVKNATCPVLTVPGNWDKPEFNKVLFPIRLKPGAIDKYFYARPIIEKNNSEIVLLGLSDKGKPNDLKEVTSLMDKLKLQLHYDNVIFKPLLIPCDDFPSKAIEIAKEQEVDLIILTANLDYDFKAYFIGPFAQQVINHSKLPVLNIKPPIDTSEQFKYIELAAKWGGGIKFAEFGGQSH